MTPSTTCEEHLPHVDPSSAPLDQLYQQIRADGQLAVIIDPLALDSTWDVLAQLATEQVPHLHLKDPLFKERPQSAPLLASLNQSNWSLLERLTGKAHLEAVLPGLTPRSVCGFIESPLPLNRLAVVLQKALDARVGNQSIYFRYFDPRIFFHLPRLLSSDRLAALLHGVSSWSCFDWSGRLHRHVLPALASTQLVQRELRLTEKQWWPFTVIEHFNASQMLFAMHHMPFSPDSAERRFAQVCRAVELGLTKPEDVAYFLACCESSGTDLSQHAQWEMALNATQADVPLADAIEQLCAISLPDSSPRH